jgi:hypothetical protein
MPAARSLGGRIAVCWFAAAGLVLALCAAPACASAELPPLDDARLTAQVLTVLLNDPQLGALRLEVETRAGVVTLAGRVGVPDEAERAVALARQVVGVTEVRSRLTVAPPGR